MSEPGTDQQRAERLRELVHRTLSGGCKILSRGAACECPLCDVDYVLARAEHAATDAARIAELERERDDAVAQSRIDCTAYEALQADAVAFAQRIERLEQALFEARKLLLSTRYELRSDFDRSVEVDRVIAAALGASQ